MAKLPKFTITEMLESGVHFGHKASYWNPKMDPFIHSTRNGMHIINLQTTAPLLFKSMKAVMEVAKDRRNKVLFVGTKRQASDTVKEAATRCGQFYVNHRWLGGMLTNWSTISKSIKKMQEYEKILETAKTSKETKYNKKELLNIDRKREKLDMVLGGIRKMGGKPDLIFVIDTNKESIAIQEARKLNIPIIAVIDTNSNPDNLDYIIPGNDDSSKAIRFYCKMISDAILSGMKQSLENSGEDVKGDENLEEVDSKLAEEFALPKDVNVHTKAIVEKQNQPSPTKIKAKPESKVVEAQTASTDKASAKEIVKPISQADSKPVTKKTDTKSSAVSSAKGKSVIKESTPSNNKSKAITVDKKSKDDTTEEKASDKHNIQDKD